MPEFTASLDIHVAPERVFDFIRDVKNLPSFTPTMSSAELESGGRRVHATGGSHGHAYDVHGSWQEDRQAMKISWSGDGNHEYSGSMRVNRVGRGSRVDAELHFGVFNQQHAGGRSEKEWREVIQRGLDEALYHLKQRLEPPSKNQQQTLTPGVTTLPTQTP